jgi:hypothetical protein
MLYKLQEIYLSGLCIIFLSVHTNLFSQSSVFNKTITANYNNATLKEVISDLSNKTGVRFSYSPNKVPEDQRITASLSKISLNDALGEVFKNLPVRYELVDDYVILKKGPVPEQAESVTKPQNYTLSGYVKDISDGEFLVGAAVYLKEIGTGTRTNNYGYFSLTIPPGKYSLQISYIGYQDMLNEINLLSNTKADFSMNILPQKLEEVTISSVRDNEIVSKAHAAQSEIIPVFVGLQPALMGEPDIIKNLEFQPGICFYGDGSSYFHVRGGNYDQNLIILDEAVIFNPSHLLGIFTPIIPDAVKSVDIYKADFPVNYGGRLSSVIDIQAKDGNKSKFSASGDLGFYSSRATIEGPFKKDASSFFISFRRSFFDLYLKPLVPNLINLHFYDFTTKTNIKLSRKDRLFLTLYKGEDKFKMKSGDNDASGLNWGNTSFTMRWNHIFGPRMFTNTTLATSKYDYYMHASYNKNEYWLSKISNTVLKHEISFYASPGITWKYGLIFGSYDFNPGNYYTPENAGNFQVSPVKSTEVIAYAGAEHQIISWLRVNYGLRITSWSDKGKNSETFVVQYDSLYNALGTTQYKNNEVFYRHTQLQPCLSLSFKTGNYSSIKASYNRTNQNINLITNSVSPFNSMEVWLPAGPNIKPQYADITDVGFTKAFTALRIKIQADIYYKWLYNQIGYKYHAEMLINPNIEGELRQGNGNSYGFEISLNREIGKLCGQISYTYSRAFLKIDGLNNNEEYPATFDRPHNLSMSLAFKARPRWLITSDFALLSGARITTPTSFYYYKGYQVPVYTSMNNDQLPTYFRLDLSTTIQLNKPGRNFKHSLTFAIYNMFGQQNPIFLYFNKTVAEDGKLVIPVDQLNQSQLTPSIRYTFVVMPSLTYQFQF